MLTVLWYSTFTLLSAFAVTVWQLAILRLLAGIGIGGEWAMGGTFVAEEWPRIAASPARATCTPDTISDSCWRRWRITASAATLAGAGCSPSADCRRFCWLIFVMA